MIGKFKVWDSHDKKWVKPDKGESYLLSDNGDLHCLFINPDTEDHANFYKCAGHVFPVFSTGETDKNGNELFGGDIVVKIDGMYGEIRFDDNEWCIDFGYIKMPVSAARMLEKIGNKYENPEILEQK